MDYKGLQVVVPVGHSCFGRCGYELAPSDCRCDPECESFNDCCVDYHTACSTDNHNDKSALDSTIFNCYGLKDSYRYLDSVLLVGKCSQYWKYLPLRRRCEGSSESDPTKQLTPTDFLDEWPVFDEDGNNFKNVLCAICNGVDFRDIHPWNISLLPLFQSTLNVPVSSECETEYNLGNVGKRLRFCYPDMISQCPKSYENASITSGCHSYSGNICPKLSLSGNKQRFKNHHCLVCNKYDFNEFSEQFPPCSDTHQVQGPSFLQRIWKFTDAPSRSSRKEDIGQCLEPNHLFDPYSRMCRIVSCQRMRVSDDRLPCSFPTTFENTTNGLCCENQKSWILFTTNDPTPAYLNDALNCFLDFVNVSTDEIHYKWKINQYLGMFLASVILESNASVCNMADYLDSALAEFADKLLSCGIAQIEYMYMCDRFPAKKECEGAWFNGTTNDFARLNSSDLVDVFILNDKFIVPHRVLHEISYLHNEEAGFIKENTVHVCGKEANILTCPFVTLHEKDSYTILIQDNKTTLLMSNATIINAEYVMFPDGRILTCTKSLEHTTHLFSYPGFLDIGNTIGTILSLSAHVLLFGLHISYSQLRHFQGYCIMSLSVSYSVAQVLPMISSKVDLLPRVCVAFAIITHYAWLTTFTWMTMIGSNLFHLFVFQPIQSSEIRESSTLFKIILPIVGWIVSTIIVVPCVSLHTATNFSFEYGSSTPCWISDPTANLIGFGIPVAIYLGINVFLFLAVVFASCRNLRQSRQLQNQRTDVTLKDVILCFKVNM